MKALTLRWRRVPEGEEGVALVSVVAGMMIASVFAFTALGFALNSQKASRNNQDWNAALAAAQAGIDDYIGYLNRNDNYARTVDCGNIALKGPNTGANSCSWTSSTPLGWKPVVAGETNGPAFHYDVNPAKLASEGVVLVKSTGRSGNETRTLEVGVGRGGSTDFLYYTDHEDADPDNVQAYPSGMDSRCSQYWWQLSTGRPSSWGCTEITFIGGDVLDGPVHTNDTPLMTTSGGVRPKFLDGLSTSEPDCKRAVRGNASTYKYCDRTQISGDYGTSYPSYKDPLYLPDTSAEFATFPGCQYRGATRIKFQADGTMRVWSAESTTTAACGGTAPNGVTVDVPNDQVIYVAGGTSGTRLCRSGEIGDGLPLGTYTSTSPTANYTYDLRMADAAQYCGQGNVYVEGVLQGRVTVAAANNVVVTGDLVMARGLGGTDMLGLVASNSVEVFNPWIDTRVCSSWVGSGSSRRCNGTWSWANSPTQAPSWPKRYTDPDNGSAYPSNGIQITAAIQTLQHSFFVQNYWRGNGEGQLYVRGAIAQEWRGIVGRGSAGYLKDYRYDKRLKFSSPPYFPQWTNAVWGGRYTGEIAAQYGP